MSLLDSDNDDSYADEDQPVWRSHTDDPLFSDTPHKGKTKKAERKVKGEERKNVPKPVHWSKQKENVVQEKTPKKPKGQSATKSSIPWTPPGSPKSLRASESKGRGGAVEGKGGRGAGATGGTAQLQPSPNVKSHRKRYSQLGAESSSEGEGEGEGFLLSNKPVLSTEDTVVSDHAVNPLDRPSNPFLIEPLLPGTSAVAQPPPSSSLFPSQQPVLGAQGPVLGAQGPGLGMASSTLTAQQQQLWDPIPSSYILPPTAPAFDVPTAQAPPLVGGASNPLLGMDSGPAQDYVQTNPFLTGTADSAFQPTFSFPPPPTNALSTFSMHPDSQEATPPSAMAPPPGGVADWSISEDLRQKCLQQFQELEPVSGRMKGDKAKEFFIRSKLPSQELSAIW